MRRLVYAPKAYVFIRSSNLDGQVFDVSSDLVRGSVHQVTGDVSTAEFELRNRYQKWLRDPDDSRSIFLPMDMVTIWLQRIAGRPVQVFTGYLDEVPYYQGYPQNAIFKATCTLKKLGLTWFDPGLQTFLQWVDTNSGWFYNPQTGQGINIPAKVRANIQYGTAALSATGSQATTNDDGFSNLLGRFMVDIAGWSPDTVLIGELNEDIPKIAAQLFNKINSDVTTDLTALQQFLAQTMGVKGFGVDPSTPTDTNANPVQQPAVTSLIANMKTVADRNNIPILVLVFAAYVLTNFDVSYSVGPTAGVSNWGYGIFALQPPTAGSGADAFTTGNPIFGGGTIPTSTTINGKTPAQLGDLATSVQVFCDRLNSNQGSWVQAAKGNDLNSIVVWVQKALGRLLPKVNQTAAFAQAKAFAASGSVVTPPTASPNSTTYTTSFTDPGFTRNLTPQDKQTVNQFYTSSSPWLAALATKVLGLTGNNLRISPPPSKNANIIAFTSGNQQLLKDTFSAFKGNSSIDSVTLLLSGANEPLQLKAGVQSNVPVPISKNAPTNTIVFTQTKAPASTVNSVAGSGSSTSTTDTSSNTSAADAGSNISLTALSTFSADAAFAANFAFPANYQESLFLTGNRALMNDISCLDGVKQFCQASLRTFRSLPDGRFLAFYPDYFGAYRNPYWQIYNIEITDFGIQLNDDSLATHVYIVGDTFDGDGQISVMDEASTYGVATITQAFMLNSFIEPFIAPENNIAANLPPALGRLADAYAFLQHYGARPHKEDQPLIRNVFYEFLMAWQKFMYLWASQFATNVTFTFQPEVMAGGLIAFPDHGIQMYCEEVTHSFDYSSGFTTEAVLVAPSLLKKDPKRTEMPGFALGGNINTVGTE